MGKLLLCVMTFVLCFQWIHSRSISSDRRFRRSESLLKSEHQPDADHVVAQSADHVVAQTKLATHHKQLKERLLNSPHAVNILPAPQQKSKSTESKFDTQTSEASSLTNMIVARFGVDTQSLSVQMEPSLAGLGESLSSLASPDKVQIEPDFLPPGIVFGEGVPMVPHVSSIVEATPDQTVAKTGILTLPRAGDLPFSVHLSEPVGVRNIATPSDSTSEIGVVFPNTSSAPVTRDPNQEWVWPDGTVAVVK